MPYGRRFILTMENLKESIKYGRKYERYYARKVSRDLCGIPRTKIKPDFEFGNDDAAWTGPSPHNPRRRILHLGLAMFTRFPDGTAMWSSENEWNTNVRYVLTHEEGHVIHTTDRAFRMAQVNGTRAVLEYAYAKASGNKIVITRDEQSEAILKELREKYHVYMNMHMISSLVHMIVNSIEDGRMERRMSSSRPGFRADLRYCRGQRWLHSPISSTNIPDMSDVRDVFITICNQILSFATMGIWQRGYLDYLVGSPVETQVKVVLPDIKAGVTARSCKKGMESAVEIIKKLCPVFYEACLMDDFEQMMSEMIQQLAQALPDLNGNGDDNSTYDADEKSKEQQDTNPDVGTSQLADSENNDEKPLFNIFTDDVDENNEESSDSDGSSQNKSAIDGNGQNGNDEKKSSQGDEQKKKQQKGHNLGQGGQAGSLEQDATDGSMEDVRMIEKAMEDAAANTFKESSYSCQSVQMEGKDEKKDVVDKTSIAASAKNISSICTDFHEYFRKYELTENLPISIEQQGKVIRRRYEEYFQSRRRPAERGMRVGRLDPTRLTAVVTKSMDIFKTPGDDNVFSGCIEILVDHSGSMSGEKMENAMEICALLEEIFKGMIPLKIVAFDMYRETNFEIIKNWNDDCHRNCCWNYLKYCRDGGGTPTKEALLIAQQEILARPEKHKLIILITDESAGCCNDKLKDVIRTVRASGVQLSSVYIESHMSDSMIASFKGLFDNIDALAVEPCELSDALLPVVKKFTHKN